MPMNVERSGKAVSILCKEGFADDEWVDIERFKDWSESREGDYGRLYHYFVALLDLAAELTLDRNYIAIKEFEAVFPYDALLKTMKNPRVDSRLRSGAIKVLINLHIDQDPLEVL